ncbi:MAG: FtsX-like permease family protein [Armatimonadota bacterium]
MMIIRKALRWMLLVSAVSTIAYAQAPVTSPDYMRLANSVDTTRIRTTVNSLSAIDSRVCGYPGADKAAGWVADQFRTLGLTDITTESFPVSVPVDQGSVLQVNGKSIHLNALWPNLVRTSQLPPEGVTGSVIYVGDGKLPNFSGKRVQGSIVLVNYNSGTEWLNAPRLGAKAVVFVEPDDTMRGESEAKFIGIPVNVPRFFIRKSDAVPLMALCASTQDLVGTLSCSMQWQKKEGKNVIAWIKGSDPKMSKQVIVLSAYFDSMSVVPAIAPGAESACGIASMLELARTYVKEKPKRSIMFVATGGHFTSLEGIRQWMDRHMNRLERPNVGQKLFMSMLKAVGIKPKQKDLMDIYLWAGLDISSRNKQVGLFYKGYFYDMREDVQNRFSDLSRICRENADKVLAALGLTGSRMFADGVNPVDGKIWRNYLAGKYAFDAELVTLSGANGITFCTTDDSRPMVDTPFDTPNRVNYSNVAMQTKLLSGILWHVFNDPNNVQDPALPHFAIDEPGNFQRMGLQGGFSTISGQVVRFEPKKSFIPKEPVLDSLAVVRHATKTFAGVRGNLIQIVNDKAEFRFPGVAPVTAYGWNRPTSVAAYRVDRTTGNIDFAPDQGAQGAVEYPVDFPVTTGQKTSRIVVFNCVPTSLFDLVDQQALRALTTMNVLDAETNGTPRMYGWALATQQDYLMTSYVEDVAVVFSQPGSRIKLIMGVGPGATRFVMINSTKQYPEGIGYRVQGVAKEVGFGQKNKNYGDRDNFAAGGVITNTAFRVAEDMWTLDEYRMTKLRKFRIINEGLEQLHAMSKKSLDMARVALAAKDYAKFDIYSRAAWGYEARAYPDVQATANDVVRGVIFYMALLLPFAFFMERLFFGFPNLRNQLMAALGIFVVVFLLFSRIHPAFQLVSNLAVVFLAFVMLALSGLVTAMIMGKFEEQLKQINKQMSGVHRADIGRVSVAFAAFNLGVSNMRRRKARTILTSITLIMLTFIVLSFTSIVNVLRFNQVRAPGVADYNGIMIRTALWEPLQDPAYRLLSDEFRDRAVAPRAWFYGVAYGEQSSFAVRKGDRQYDVKSIVGLTPDEAEVTRPQRALKAGRWFQDGDRYVTILPSGVAESLRVGVEDVGKVSVRFNGMEYNVIGILDSGKFKTVTDLDQEPLTPVDFLLMNKMGNRAGGGSGGGQESGFREYVHLEPDSVFYTPYRTLMNQGGEIRSIAISFANKKEVKGVLDKLMPRLGLNIYSGQGPQIWRFSTLAATSGRGIEFVIIPILIAAMICLQTMLSSVFERVKEIHIFSSLGLSPTHIGLLFFAESLVYAIVGSVTGYFIAQLSAKAIVLLKIEGLYLNFSSMSAVVSTLVVVATVLLSTIYPARKASEVASPALDRNWHTPDPEGDEWVIPMPFSVNQVQATGLSSFLGEWLSAYEDYSVGDFVTQSVTTDNYMKEHGRAYTIGCTAWLAPFDLGVSQTVMITADPTDTDDIYSLTLTLTRLSGDIANWKRVNRRFMNTLRKQFLIWRTLSAEDRNRYFDENTAVEAQNA